MSFVTECIESLAIAVPHKRAEEIRRLLKHLDILRKDLEVERDEHYIYFPITEAHPKLSNYSTTYMCFKKRIQSIGSFKELLQDKLPQEILMQIPRSFDIIGDIALIQLPPQIAEKYGEVIGRAIMSVNKNIKSVYARGEVRGEFRVREIKHIAGDKKTWTIHKEHGVRMYVDISKAYINPSLAEEHRRIAEMVKDNELVLDMFTGVGPFALITASRKKATIVAIDINPHAISCLIKSLELNKLKGIVIPIVGDSKLIIRLLKPRQFNHTIMNLPHKSIEFLDEACYATNNHGLIHVYIITNSEEQAINIITKNCSCYKEIVEIRRVIDFAPGRFIFRVSLRVGHS